MRLNRKSWHRKIHKMWFTDRATTNFCAYARQIIRSIGYTTLLLTGVLTVIFGLPLLPLSGKDAICDLTVWNYFLSFLSIWGGIAALSTGTVYLVNWLEDRAMRPKADKKKEPSIFKEYIKAKTGKYCPKIEWYDE